MALSLSLAVAVSSNLIASLLGDEGATSSHMSSLCKSAYVQTNIIQLFANLFRPSVVSALYKGSLLTVTINGAFMF